MLQKGKMDMRTCAGTSAPCAHVRTLKRIYAHTRTHISEKISAPICKKIAAPARVHVRVHARTHTKGLLVANPANQPISKEMPKCHFLTHAWNLNLFEPTSFEVLKRIVLSELYSSKCLSMWVKVDKWDYFQISSQDFFSLL